MNEQNTVRNRKMILSNEKLDSEEDVNNNKQNNYEAKINRNADKVREEVLLEEQRKIAKELGLEPYSTIPSDAATSERDNFTETKAEKEKRMNIESYSKSKDGMYTLLYLRKIIILVLIFALVITPFIGISGLSDKILSSNKDAGNPYNCAYCKYKQKACHKHKNYKEVGRKAYLREKIDSLVYVICYENDTEELILLKSYYNDSEYDINCDFCNEIKSECTGCNLTRLRLQESVKEVFNKLKTRDKQVDKEVSEEGLSIEEINFIKEELYKKYDCSIGS